MDTKFNAQPQNENLQEENAKAEDTKKAPKDRQGLKTAGVAAAAAMGGMATMKAAEGIAALHDGEEDIESDSVVEPDGVTTTHIHVAEATHVRPVGATGHGEGPAPIGEDDVVGVLPPEPEEEVNVDDVRIEIDGNPSGEDVAVTPIEPTDDAAAGSDIPMPEMPDMVDVDPIEPIDPVDMV